MWLTIRFSKKALCGFLLVVLTVSGCGEGEKSKVGDRDAAHTLVEELRMDQSSDVDISSHSGDSAGEGDSAVVSEGQDSEPAEPVADSVAEEGGQYTWSFADLIEAGLIEPGGISLSGTEPLLAWDDRTQNKTVRFVVDSITLNDCVMRGEIRNHSEDLYARNVTVTIGSINGEESAQWHWPLTMEPGETAPFEIRIGWFPHAREFYEGELEEIVWNLFGNTSIDIFAELSAFPDIRRAFRVNYDETPPIELYWAGEHRFPVYDERALELEASKYWYWNAEVYSATSRQRFGHIYPEELVKGKDIEPMVAEFIPYESADIYYLPSILYPEVYKAGENDIASNVRVYQAYKQGSRVIDVWELVPHSVLEHVDHSGLLIDRQFIPKNEFTNSELLRNVNAHILLLNPYNHLPDILERNSEGVGWTDDRSGWTDPQQVKNLWIGGVSHREVASADDSVAIVANATESSCYAPGGLHGIDGYFRGERRVEEHFTLGYSGAFDKLEFDGYTTDHIYVDRDSIVMGKRAIRGLIHNGLEGHFARNVIVSVVHKDTKTLVGTWRWPLSLQPGERAPFEVWHSEPDLEVEQIEFRLDAILSEEVDPTRSFRIESLWGGRVYGEDFIDLYNYRPYDSDYVEIETGTYLNQDVIDFGGPQNRYLKEDFLELYEDIIQPEGIEDIALFRFTDIYARLEPPPSHPELAKIVKAQYIDRLRAFVAILDSNGGVVEVNELTPFTPVYGHSNVDKSYVAVDRIPAPNLWSPNAVRLLVTIPYEDEADMEAGYGYQVWIGGASEPVG